MKKMFVTLLLCFLLPMSACRTNGISEAGTTADIPAPSISEVPQTTGAQYTTVIPTSSVSVTPDFLNGPLAQSLKHLGKEALRRMETGEKYTFQRTDITAGISVYTNDMGQVQIQEDVILVDTGNIHDPEIYNKTQYILFVLLACEAYADSIAPTWEYDPYSGVYPPFAIWLHPGYKEAGFDTPMASWIATQGMEGDAWIVPEEEEAYLFGLLYHEGIYSPHYPTEITQYFLE